MRDVDGVAERRALGYYEALGRAFARASLGAGRSEHSLLIGERHIHLSFAGHGLGPVLLPALAPVSATATSGAATAEVELWDGRSTGIAAPEPSWRLRDVIARGDVRSLSGGRFGIQVDSWNRVLSMWDRERRRGVFWVADADRLPYWVPATPLRTILHWALASAEAHLLHAGAVGDEHGGALLVGAGGSGKSTTALLCLEDGIGYVGDDYVLVTADPSPRAVSVYGTAKLNPASVKLMPGLTAEPPPPSDTKLVINVARTRPTLMRRSIPISAILMPQVTPGRLAIRPASAADALRTLAPTTILQHAEESATGMALMSRLVRRVPAYVLELGSDARAVAPALRALLDGRPRGCTDRRERR